VTASPPQRATPALTAEILRTPALADLEMRVVTGEAGFDRAISWGRIQRPGLALAGFIPYIKPGRIQILGESELNYLDTMPMEVRRERIEAICSLPVAAFVVTKAQTPPDDIVRECRLRGIPLLVSDRTTSVVIQSITRVLEDELAPATTLHGVLVDVYGMGVLLLGESGIGKSECALDLVHRGHRLVADDAVDIRRYPSGALVGRAAEMIRYHMELRGIGIINIKHLFGVSAVRASKSIELIIELQRWDPAKKYDRLGLDGETYTILERERPLLRLPVASGRNLALLIEIAARNELLKSQGYDAAKEFARRVDEEIAKNSREEAGWKPVR
jgi:HPr kinase/phosphorylase